MFLLVVGIKHIGIIFLALVFSAVKVYKKSRLSADKSEEIKKEMAGLEKRNGELAAEAARLESESGQEREIRKRFDVAKPGEKISVEMYKMIQFKNETYKRDFNEKTYLGNYKQC